MKTNLLQKNIPKGWELNSLGNLAVIKKGEQLNRLNMDEAGKYPALNGGIAPSGYTDKWNTEADIITISEGGNSCGYVNFNKEKFWCGGHCYAILNLKENIDNNFLYQALKFKQDQIMKLRVGSGLPNIQKRSIDEFKLLFPELKTEQQKIAEILSSVDEEIAKTEEIIKKTEKLKKGLIQQLFTQGIGHTKFKKTELGNIPTEWEIKKLEDVVFFENGKAHENFIDDNGEFIVINSKFIAQDRKVIKRTRKGLKILNKGDIAIVMSDIPQGKALAKCFFIDEDNKYTLNQRIGLLRPLNACNKYFFYVLNRNKYFLNFSNDTSQTNLRRQQVLDCLISVPPINEQKKIVNIIDSTDEKISINKKLKEKLIQLKKGLMSDLLSGKVRMNS